jgi:two-component system sensor histidine kinase RegB
MAGSTAAAGESIEARTVGEILDEATSNIRKVPAVWRKLPPEVARLPVKLPPRAMSQALRSLVTNAQDASPADAAVEIGGALSADRLRLDIVDKGKGMPPEILARVGEPFFTTKDPGRGMGLGLFLARAVVESVGGTLIIESSAGKGTTVSVLVPTEVAHVD